MTTATTYGTVTRDDAGTEVFGTEDELRAWATRPGAIWPCSALAGCRYGLAVDFDPRGDLIDIRGDDETSDLMADELNAWTSDVLREAGYLCHPAIR